TIATGGPPLIVFHLGRRPVNLLTPCWTRHVRAICARIAKLEEVHKRSRANSSSKLAGASTVEKVQQILSARGVEQKKTESLAETFRPRAGNKHERTEGSNSGGRSWGASSHKGPPYARRTILAQARPCTRP